MKFEWLMKIESISLMAQEKISECLIHQTDERLIKAEWMISKLKVN